MSLALVNGLASSSVDQYLTEIDVQSKDLEEQQGDLSFGPFGVFNLTTGTAEIPSPDIDDPDFVIASSLGMLNDASLANAPMSELSTAEEMLGDLNSALQWTDIFNLDPAPMGMNVTPPIWGYETLPTAWSSPVGPEVSPGKSQYDLLSHDLASLQCASHESLMLSDATFLLRHFQEHVMTHVAWLPMSQKSPWIILNIPSAMITLDQLTYMKRHRRQVTKHASLANLYAILACASYHLAMNPEFASDKTNQHWEQLTGIAYADAKHHMSMSLEHEFQGPNKAKYKEQLMANLSLATFAVRDFDTYIFTTTNTHTVKDHLRKSTRYPMPPRQHGISHPTTRPRETTTIKTSPSPPLHVHLDPHLNRKHPSNPQRDPPHSTLQIPLVPPPRHGRNEPTSTTQRRNPTLRPNPQARRFPPHHTRRIRSRSQHERPQRLQHQPRRHPPHGPAQ